MILSTLKISRVHNVKEKGTKHVICKGNWRKCCRSKVRAAIKLPNGSIRKNPTANNESNTFCYIDQPTKCL